MTKTVGRRESGQDAKGGAEISLQAGGTTFEHIRVEASDSNHSPASGNPSASTEDEQPKWDNRKNLISVKQVPETDKDQSGSNCDALEDADLSSVSCPASGNDTPKSAFGTSSATSIESSSEPKNSDNPKRQLSVTPGDGLAGDRDTTDTGPTTETEETPKGVEEIKHPVNPEHLTLGDISDDDLSWSSDIDAPSDTSEPDTDWAKFAPLSTRFSKLRAKDSKEAPWNAVCVVGLRVYSKTPEVKIEALNAKDDDKNTGFLGKM